MAKIDKSRTYLNDVPKEWAEKNPGWNPDWKPGLGKATYFSLVYPYFVNVYHSGRTGEHVYFINSGISHSPSEPYDYGPYVRGCDSNAENYYEGSEDGFHQFRTIEEVCNYVSEHVPDVKEAVRAGLVASSLDARYMDEVLGTVPKLIIDEEYLNALVNDWEYWYRNDHGMYNYDPLAMANSLTEYIEKEEKSLGFVSDFDIRKCDTVTRIYKDAGIDNPYLEKYSGEASGMRTVKVQEGVDVPDSPTSTEQQVTDDVTHPGT